MRAQKLSLPLFFLILLTVEPSFSYGRTFYVSPNGSNKNPGTQEKPWAHPAFACRQLKAGDTLIILEGSYTLSSEEDILTFSFSGTPSAWITVRGEGKTKPILKGKNNLFTMIDLSGRGYIRIENLELTSEKGSLLRDGIEAISLPAHDIVLSRLFIHHLDEFGINMADIQNLAVSHCVISYCGFGCIGGPKGQHGGWKNVLIEYCLLSYSGHYYQGKAEPGPYDRPDGFGIEASQGPIEIAYTYVEHNRRDGLDSKAEKTTIHDCIVANNSCDGIKLWGDGSRVENCIIYGRGDGNKEPTPWSALVIQTEKPNARFEINNTSIDDTVGNNYLMYVQYDFPDVPLFLTIRNCVFSARGENSPIFFGKSVQWIIENPLFFMPNHPDTLLYWGENAYNLADINRKGKGNSSREFIFQPPPKPKREDF